MNLKKKNIYEEDYKVINNIRTLSLDMINHAKSGHPGICLGASTILYTLYSRFMNIDLDDDNIMEVLIDVPQWEEMMLSIFRYSAYQVYGEKVEIESINP